MTGTPAIVPTTAPANEPVSPEPSPPPPEDLATTLVETMLVLRGLIQNFGGQIDAALRGDPFSGCPIRMGVIRLEHLFGR